MKKIYSLLTVLLCTMVINAQTPINNEEEAFGMFNKQDIDVNLLSSIITEKQNEIKQRVLSDLVVNNIQTSNYTVYNTIYNLVNILTTEKNKTIMTRDLIQQMADYAVAYSLTKYFYHNELELAFDDFSKSKQDQKEILFGAQIEHLEKTEKQERNLTTKQLVNNYLLDQMYTKLRDNYFLTSKGFYREDPFRSFFNDGLDINYNKITRNTTIASSIDRQLNTFLNQLSTISADSDLVFKFVQSETMNLKDFRKINTSDIIILLGLFENSIVEFREQVGRNSFVATIGDIIVKYVMVEGSDGSLYDFEIDVESIILSLEDRFYNVQRSPLAKNAIGIQPFLTLGINYGKFINKNNQLGDPLNPQSLYQIALASEKIGVRFLFNDNKYRTSFAPLEWYEYKGKHYRWKSPQKAPVVSNIHALVYFSGVLYNVVNLTTEDNFNYPILGAGLGMEFFNGLQINVSAAVPIVAQKPFQELGKNTFINFGFDIPIFEYLKALRNR